MNANEKFIEPESGKPMLQSLIASFLSFAKDIKIAHSIFALPFAASAIFIANLSIPSFSSGIFLLVCMISARSYAMGMNRYLDYKIDLKNPRTSSRKIPSGELKPWQGLAWSVFWALLFIASAFSLNTLSGNLSVPLLIILGGYSLMKRISSLTHLYLGMCLGLSPIAVSISLSGEASPAVILLGISIAVWTAGFDILYSLQDRDFDKVNNLKSIPSRFSPLVSLYISRALFVLMSVGLWVVGNLIDAGFIYYVGVILISMMLVYQHWLVRDAKVDGTSKNINAAFFNTNAYISILFLAVIVINYYF